MFIKLPFMCLKTMKELVFSGDDLLIVDFPQRTRIVYPPNPLSPPFDVRKTIDHVLNFPLGSDPLQKLVSGNSKVTIAFDDPCIPLPPMRDDPRAYIIESVLKQLYKVGVKNNNIILVCANGLHRKWSKKELKNIIGARIFKEFSPNKIFCHDAEDPENIVSLGKTSSGYEVEVNRFVIDSNLTVYININWTSMNGGWKSIVVGLGTYKSIRHHHNPKILEKSPLLNPSHSEMHKIYDKMGEVIEKNARIFTIETVLNNDIFHPYLGALYTKFLQKSHKSSSKLSPLLKFWSSLPKKFKGKIRSFVKSNYKPIEVNAGNVNAVHKKTLEKLSQQQNVLVEGQSDVLVIGLPNISPYSVFSSMNPVLVANLALSYAFNLYQNKPLVKRDGVFIIAQPCYNIFNKKHHPSYIEFFNKVLKETKDPYEMEKSFEEDFATRPTYIQKYRYGNAFHGVHPFYAWYFGAYALKYLRNVFIAGAKSPKTVKRLGFTPIKSIEKAVKKAEELKGKDCTITYQFIPPLFACEVK